MKKALIVGINTYPGSPLRGCVNDANLMKSTLRNQFGFENIKLLLDNQATTANMLRELNTLVDGAAPGDMLFFHFSGHGSQMVDKNAEEADGLDEIICPVDLNWVDKVIKDDDLKAIFDKVPNGAELVVCLDCCNSGGGLDQDNQYQPITDRSAQDLVVADGRFLTPPAFAVAGAEEAKVGFKPKMIQSRNVNTTGLMLSGCQSHQTSADAYIGGKYQGAFTYALVKTLADNNFRMEYVPLIEDINQFMVGVGFTQRPELNGSPSLFNAQFLVERSITSGLEEPEELLPPVSVTPIKVEKPKKKKDFKPLIIGGFVVALAAAAYFLI